MSEAKDLFKLNPAIFFPGYIAELEQQNKEMRETQLKLAQEVIEWRLRFNELSKELSEATGKQRITVIEETKEQIIFMAGNRE